MPLNFKQILEKYAALNAELLPHQQRVIDKLKTQDALLLYHGLGSGKTLSSIAASEPYKSVNVVVPAALRENYKKELEKFHANPAKRHITSYEGAVNKGLPDADFLILDEAHRLGTSGSKRTQSIYEHAPKHQKRLLLTGTPIKNKPHELAPLSRLLDPSSKELPLAEAEFNKKFIGSQTIHHKGFNRFREALGLLEPGVKPIMQNPQSIQKAFKGKVDYYKPDQKDYPTVSYKTVPVDMTPEQEDIYKTVINKANPLLAAKVRSNIPPSKKDLRDMNAFMTAARTVSNTTRPYGGKSTSPKLQHVVNNIESLRKENPAHKGIIYSNYLEGGLNEISDLLTQKQIPHAKFTGELSDKERQQVVKDFNEDKTPFILASASGTEGLDLKGGRSVHIVEPHWHSTRVNQVVGRVVRHKSHAHLPEKDRNVTVYQYHSTVPKTGLQKFFKRPAHTAADEYLSNLSHAKDELNNQFLDLLKTSAILSKNHYTLMRQLGSKSAATKTAPLVAELSEQAAAARKATSSNSRKFYADRTRKGKAKLQRALANPNLNPRTIKQYKSDLASDSYWAQKVRTHTYEPYRLKSDTKLVSPDAQKIKDSILNSPAPKPKPEGSYDPLASRVIHEGNNKLSPYEMMLQKTDIRQRLPGDIVHKIYEKHHTYPIAPSPKPSTPKAPTQASRVRIAPSPKPSTPKAPTQASRVRIDPTSTWKYDEALQDLKELKHILKKKGKDELNNQFLDLLKTSSLKHVKKIIQASKNNPEGLYRILTKLKLRPEIAFDHPDILKGHEKLKNYGINIEDLHASLKDKLNINPSVYSKVKNIKASGNPHPKFSKADGKALVISSNKFLHSADDTTKVYRGLKYDKNVGESILKTQTGAHFTPSKAAASGYSRSTQPNFKRSTSSIVMEVDKSRLDKPVYDKFSKFGPDYSTTQENTLSYIRENTTPHMDKKLGTTGNKGNVKELTHHPGFKFDRHPRYEQRFLGQLNELPDDAVKYYRVKHKGHYSPEKSNISIFKPVNPPKNLDPKQQKLLNKKIILSTGEVS